MEKQEGSLSGGVGLSGQEQVLQGQNICCAPAMTWLKSVHSGTTMGRISWIMVEALAARPIWLM